MKASSELPTGKIPFGWLLAGAGVLLISWGFLGAHHEDALQVTALVSLWGMTAAVALLNGLLARWLSRLPHAHHLNWITIASLSCFMLCIIPFFDVAFDMGRPQDIEFIFAWHWSAERLLNALAFIGLALDARFPDERRHRYALPLWILACLATSLYIFQVPGQFTHWHEAVLGRPWEILPGLLMFISVVLLFNNFLIHLSRFGKCVLLYLVISLCTQFGYAILSHDFSDGYGRDMLLLRLLGQILLFVGICYRLLDLLPAMQQPAVAQEPAIPAAPPASAVSTQEQFQSVSRKVLLSLMEDFHEAREREAAAKQFAESIIEAMPITVFVKDADNLRYQRLNRAGEEMLGLQREQCLGKSDHDFFSAEQADWFVRHDQQVLASTELVDVAEEPVQTPRGIRWLHTRKIAIRNPQGKPLYLLGISEDITERRELEQRFTLLFEVAPNGLMLVNQANVIILANKICCEIFGYPREELVGQTLQQLLPMDVRPHHSDLMQQFWHNPRTRKMSGKPNLMGMHRDGRPIPLDIALQPLPWQGELYVLAALTDITERHRFIQQLEQTSRYKNLFLANMSHELRTPMNSIIGFTEKVLNKVGDQLDERNRDALVTVRRNAHHLLGLINDVLDLSKIEAGKMDVEVEEFDLVQQLELIRPEYHQMAKTKALGFSMQLPEPPLWMSTDRRRLLQICHNLMSNAVKYTEAGAVTLRVNSESHPELGEIVRLAVTDTGLGISTEDQEKLFKEFGRAAEVRAKNIQGTGLGLLITSQLVGILGGLITVESEHGQGSTFTVLMPLHKNSSAIMSPSD